MKVKGLGKYGPHGWKLGILLFVVDWAVGFRPVRGDLCGAPMRGCHSCDCKFSFINTRSIT